jgi:hypothetical protein
MSGQSWGRARRPGKTAQLISFETAQEEWEHSFNLEVENDALIPRLGELSV